MTEDWERVHLLDRIYLNEMLTDEEELRILVLDKDNILKTNEDKIRTYGESLSRDIEEGIFIRSDISSETNPERRFD